jgi:probable HAF family extracellular repeat protein
MKTSRRFARALFTVMLPIACLLAGSAHARHLIDWTFVDLGALHPGGQSFAVAVNNRGDVAGYAEAASGAMHGVLWQNGVMRDLGVPPGASEVFVTDINSEGRISGVTSDNHAVTWQDGAWSSVDLGGADARTINRSGDLAGTALVGGVERGMVLRDGVLTDVGALTGIASRITAMNDAGHVVGRSSLADGNTSHAFLWANGDMRDLGSLDRRNSVATAINNRNMVVGFAFDDAANVTGFLWYGRAFPLLADLGAAFPFGINDRGDIVGHLVGAREHDGFLVADGELVRLERLGAVAASGFGDLVPVAINERRFVVGSGEIGGRTHAFLLMPDPPISPLR